MEYRGTGLVWPRQREDADFARRCLANLRDSRFEQQRRSDLPRHFVVLNHPARCKQSGINLLAGALFRVQIRHERLPAS